MKKQLCLTFSILTYFSVLGQTYTQTDSGLFDTILNHFQQRKGWNLLGGGGIFDSVITPARLYRTEDFSISLSDRPLNVDTVSLVIENPYYKDHSDNFDDNEHLNFPISYSVIYANRLISLFRNGRFVCHELDSFQRDSDFEKRLNTRRFKYHWIVDGKLGALAGKSIYTWDGSRWRKTKTNFPLVDRPKLFEDSEFVVFCDCFGEWGGTVYFFDKADGKTYFTESTCANSVLKNDSSYLVVAQLNHMLARTEIKSIPDPRKLTQAKPAAIFQKKDGEALGYTDRSDAYKTVLDYWGILITAAFNYRDRQLYMVDLNERTFLVEVVDTNFQIVHPLFDNAVSPYDLIANNYDNYALMNVEGYFGFFRKKRIYPIHREVSVIVVDEKRIIKLDWNESQHR